MNRRCLLSGPDDPLEDGEADASRELEEQDENDFGVDFSSDDGELPRSPRGPLEPRQSMAHEMVQRGPLMPVPARRREAINASMEIEDPDKGLVERWQAGDLAAFEELIKRHEKRVFRLLMRMMGNREEAEDVAQEAFLSLHRHGHRFRSEAKFSTFVYRVAVNAALNRRRALGRRRARMERLAVRQSAGDNLPQTPRNPESSTEGSEITIKVREALDRLSPSLRTPVVLYDIEGLAYGEIAKVLGVAEGTVKSRIHRARQALRKELSGLLQQEIAS